MVKNNFPAGEKISEFLAITGQTGTCNDQNRIIYPRIIAHRGASAVAPENTIAAFREAIRVGAEGIELDVRLAADGVPVVIHDSTLSRTAGIDGKVRRLASDDLIAKDVGSWFATGKRGKDSPRFAGETIPRLVDALAVFSRFSGDVYLELKCRESEMPQLARAVCEMVADSPIRNQIVIKSFRIGAIPVVKSLCPDIRTAALFAPKITNLLRKDRFLVNLAAEVGADEISIHYALASRKLVKKAARHNLPVTIWTSDSERVLRRAMRLGIYALITNDPQRMLDRRREMLGECISA